MQFKVPQFIDIEDKVFGPLTFKQFAYLAGGAGLVYLSIRFLPAILAIVFVPAFAAFSLALAFFKYNEKPFIFTLEAFIKYHLKSKLYLWRKQPNPKKTPIQPTLTQSKTEFSDSKLKTLSWSLDVIDPKR